jgi:hypothetical protein
MRESWPLSERLTAPNSSFNSPISETYSLSSSVLKPRTNIFDLHYPLQILGMLMALSNFGLGISIGIKQKKLYNNSHTIIGTIVVGLTVLQPLWGVVHHLLYKRQLSSKNEMEEKSEVGSEDMKIENENSRHESNATSSTVAERDGEGREGKGKIMPEKWTLFGLFHRWIGRVKITLAIINGDLGFVLAKEYKSAWSFAGQVAYSVLAPVVWITWMGFIVVGFVARRGRGRRWVRRLKFLCNEWVHVYTIGRYEEKPFFF